MLVTAPPIGSNRMIIIIPVLFCVPIFPHICSPISNSHIIKMHFEPTSEMDSSDRNRIFYFAAVENCSKKGCLAAGWS